MSAEPGPEIVAGSVPSSIDERSAQTEPAPKPPSTDPYDPAEKREITRAQLASGLAVLLGVMALLLVGLTAWGKLTLDETKDLAEAIYSPIVVLTGTALGFYFGVHQSGR